MSDIDETLRDRILASLFEGETFPYLPRVWTEDELTTRRAGVIRVFESLGLKHARQLSEEYFDRMAKFVKQLGGQEIPTDFREDPNSDAWWNWISEASSIALRIERLTPLIEDYESKRTKITQRSSAFVDSVNSFIRDTGKELEFQSRLDLLVKLPNGKRISSDHLSSENCSYSPCSRCCISTSTLKRNSQC